MIKGQKLLAIIPARGGSKGVRRKNVRDLAGKPLIAWTIDAAKQSKYIDRVILSSEDAEIAQVARKHGCDVPFTRPAELATDEAPGIAPVLHAIDAVPGFSWIVLLQPTSPLRTTADIDGAIEECFARQAPSCVSVCESQESPYWMFKLGEDRRMSPLLPGGDKYERRQDLPKTYSLNGAVYVASTEFVRAKKGFLSPETVAYVMPSERSLDIDTELDLLTAEQALKQR